MRVLLDVGGLGRAWHVPELKMKTQGEEARQWGSFSGTGDGTANHNQPAPDDFHQPLSSVQAQRRFLCASSDPSRRKGGRAARDPQNGGPNCMQRRSEYRFIRGTNRSCDG